MRRVDGRRRRELRGGLPPRVMSLKPPTRATATRPQPGRRRSSQPLLMAAAAAAVSRRPLRIVTRRRRPRAALLGAGQPLCVQKLFASVLRAASCPRGLAYYGCVARACIALQPKEHCLFPYRRAPLSHTCSPAARRDELPVCLVPALLPSLADIRSYRVMARLDVGDWGGDGHVVFVLRGAYGFVHLGCNTAAASFNEDIGAWDTSGVTDDQLHVLRRSAFDHDIGVWGSTYVTAT